MIDQEPLMGKVQLSITLGQFGCSDSIKFQDMHPALLFDRAPLHEKKWAHKT